MKKLSLMLAAMLLVAPILSSGASAVQLGEKLVSFTGKTMTGKNISLDKVIGSKPVLLFFWATW